MNGIIRGTPAFLHEKEEGKETTSARLFDPDGKDSEGWR
jgi:hypothetical protein